MKYLRILLQFKRSTIRQEIEVFKEYLDDLIILANKESERLNARVDEMVANSPEDADEIYDAFSDQYGIYSKRYIELANNGNLVNAYSFFEHELKSILRVLEKYLILKKERYRNQKGSQAANLKNHIYIISGLDFTDLELLWNELDKFRVLRNLIVHNGANLIEDEDKPLTEQFKFEVISSFNGINIDNKNGDIYIQNKDVVVEYLNLTGKYLVELIDTLKKLPDEDIN